VRRIIHSRQSPAIIVAVLALIAALAGTAVAGPGADTSAFTKAKSKKVANKQITKRAPTLHVASADVAGTAHTDIKNGLAANSPAGTGFFDVVSVPLAAGKYIVFGRAVVTGNTGTTQNNQCRLLVGGSVIDTTSFGVESGFEKRYSIDLHGIAGPGSSTTAQLQCDNPGGGAGDITVSDVRITTLSVFNATETILP
jgi:hypothetical protein